MSKRTAINPTSGSLRVVCFICTEWRTYTEGSGWWYEKSLRSRWLWRASVTCRDDTTRTGQVQTNPSCATVELADGASWNIIHLLIQGEILTSIRYRQLIWFTRDTNLCTIIAAFHLDLFLHFLITVHGKTETFKYPAHYHFYDYLALILLINSV